MLSELGFHKKAALPSIDQISKLPLEVIQRRHTNAMRGLRRHFGKDTPQNELANRAITHYQLGRAKQRMNSQIDVSRLLAKNFNK